jgi:hypothetical protein
MRAILSYLAANLPTMIEDLVRRAAADDDDYDAHEDLADLADADPSRLTPHHALMLDLGLLWPAKLFRAAGADTITRAVAEIDAGQEHLRLNHLLLILAHSGHPVAEQAHRRWSSAPPPGAADLYIPPLAYTREGGWTIDADGTRRELCGDTAFEWRLRETSQPGGETSQLNDATCSWCSSPMWRVADLDFADPSVAAALAHTGAAGRVLIETCHLCSCYDTVFTQVTADGGSSWWPGNTAPGYLPEVMNPEDPWTFLPTPGPARPSPFQVSAWSAGGSTLGGHPDWIQDADHPNCPGCGQAMDYLGLINGADISDGEGAYYLHLHQPCGFAAVNYQQS